MAKTPPSAYHNPETSASNKDGGVVCGVDAWRTTAQAQIIVLGAWDIIGAVRIDEQRVSIDVAFTCPTTTNITVRHVKRA